MTRIKETHQLELIGVYLTAVMTYCRNISITLTPSGRSTRRIGQNGGCEILQNSASSGTSRLAPMSVGIVAADGDHGEETQAVEDSLILLMNQLALRHDSL